MAEPRFTLNDAGRGLASEIDCMKRSSVHGCKIRAFSSPPFVKLTDDNHIHEACLCIAKPVVGQLR